MSYPPPPGTGAPGGYPPPGGGYPPPGGGYPPQGGFAGPPPNQSNGLAIAALVVGIIGLFSCGSLSIFAVGLGIAGLSKAKKLNGSGKGMAIGGIVTGVIGLILGVILLITVVWAADKVDDIDFYCGSDDTSDQGYPCESQGSADPTPDDGNGINSDPADQVCNTDRLLYDPDC